MKRGESLDGCSLYVISLARCRVVEDLVVTALDELCVDGPLERLPGGDDEEERNRKAF